jgi:hypothetical protein
MYSGFRYICNTGYHIANIFAYGNGFSLLSKSYQLKWTSPVVGGLHPKLHGESNRLLNTGAHLTSRELSHARRLTAVSLITHVSTVIVEIAPPNAVDTVPVATAILVAKTGVL